MWKVILLTLLFMVVSALNPCVMSGEGNETLKARAYPDGKGAVSYQFEPDDVLASEDGEEWQAAKILTTAAEGRYTGIRVLFSDGNEAWVRPDDIIRNFRLIDRSELKVGQRVLYSINEPEDWDNASIRFAYFNKGKITSLEKLHRNVIVVNSSEVKWDRQVLVW
ncbi:MAG: tudor domain-containing protein [Syntrophales bacterium]